MGGGGGLGWPGGSATEWASEGRNAGKGEEGGVRQRDSKMEILVSDSGPGSWHVSIMLEPLP